MVPHSRTAAQLAGQPQINIPMWATGRTRTLSPSPYAVLRVRVTPTVCRATLQQPRARTKEALKDPARIGASAAITVPVQVT